MDALEHSRRALLKELQNAKISLETVFKTENFNDSTGVCVCMCVCECVCMCVCVCARVYVFTCVCGSYDQV